MKYNQLQFQIIASFSLLLIVLLALQTMTISGSAQISEDNTINDIMEKEATDYIARYATDTQTPLPRLHDLQVFVGTANMPRPLHDTVRGRGDGLYETDGPGSIPGPPAFNILIRTLPDGKKLYLFYNVDEYIKETNQFLQTPDVVIVMSIATAILGIILFFIIGFIVFKPLRVLAEKVKNARPDTMEDDFTEAARQDEIGLLATNIRHSYRRIQKFAEREQQLTRDVSHELRTPLSVITGAVDLIPIAVKDTNPQLDKLLGRINRATHNMEQTITTILWLAREENVRDTTESCDVNATIHEIIEDLPQSLQKEGVTLNAHHDEHLIIAAPENIFRIVFSNLLTNALSFTQSGSVDVLIGPNTVTISDTGEGIPAAMAQEVLKPHVQGKASKGFGLGLAIVKNICDRFGWQLSLSRRSPHGTVAEITFRADHPESTQE